MALLKLKPQISTYFCEPLKLLLPLWRRSHNPTPILYLGGKKWKKFIIFDVSVRITILLLPCLLSLKEKLKTKMIFSLPRVSVNISVSIGVVTDHGLLSIIHEYSHTPQFEYYLKLLKHVRTRIIAAQCCVAGCGVTSLCLFLESYT